MALSPQILQWAQSAEAQPYIAKYLPTTPTQSMGGIGMGGMDTGGYGSYLVDLINANQANPDFQQQMLGEYLNFANPLNLQQYSLNQQQDYYTQQEMGLREREATINTALSLISSEDPTIKGIGQMLLTQVFPEIANTGYGVGQTVSPAPYENITRQEALARLQDPTGISREEYEWNRFLATASDEDIRRYEEARNEWEKEKSGWGAAFRGNPFSAEYWSPEQYARSTLGY